MEDVELTVERTRIDDRTRVGRDEEGLLARIASVADVEDAKPGVAVRRVDLLVGAEVVGGVLVDAVRTETLAPLQVSLVRLRGARRRRRQLGHDLRLLFVGDVVDPDLLRPFTAEVSRVLLGDDQKVALGERDAGMGVAVGDLRERPDVGDELRIRFVGDVEDREAAVPVRDIGSIALDDRLVDIERLAVTGLRIAAPLLRQPEIGDLLAGSSDRRHRGSS